MSVFENLFLDMLHWLKFIILGECFFSFSKNRTLQKYILAVGVSISSSFVTIYLSMTGFSLFIYVLAVWLVFMLIYEEKRTRLLFVGVWSMFLISLLDAMAYTLFDAFINTSNIKEDFVANFWTQIFTVSFLLIVGWQLKRVGKGKLKSIGISYMILFTVLVVADAYVLIALGGAVIAMEQFTYDWNLRIAYIIVILGIFFQILLVLLLIVSRNESREKERVTQKYLENQIEHYRYLEHREAETKRFRHDLRSHMYVLQSYLQKKQYEEIEQHLTEMNGTMTAFEKNISVNNNIVDAILNKCDAECKKQGIQFTVKGYFPVSCDLSAYDLCTIFSNLLNNAQEAAQKGNEHRIFLGIRYNDDEIIFHFENDYAGEILIKDGKISTKKKDKEYHGMGLENVEKCVEKNKGFMHIQTENQRFIVKVRLYHTGGWDENSVSR